MHIFVRMTIHIVIGFCHAYLCTNDYPYYYWFLSCSSLYKWLSLLFLVFVMRMFLRMTIHILMGFFNVHVCTNDYPYYFWFFSCTSLYEWISILFLVFDMHMFERMTIKFLFVFVILISVRTTLFPMRFCRMGILSCFLSSFSGINRWGRAPWCLSFQWWVLRRL